MRNIKLFHFLMIVVAVVGSLSLVLFGVAHLDLIADLFGYLSMPSRLVYAITGLVVLYVAGILVIKGDS